MRRAKFSFKKLRINDIKVTEFMKISRLSYYSLAKLDAGEVVLPSTKLKGYEGMKKVGLAR